MNGIALNFSYTHIIEKGMNKRDMIGMGMAKMLFDFMCKHSDVYTEE